MRALLVLLIVAAASQCAAQNQVGTATHHLSFKEVDSLTGLPVPHPNGVLEPGEAALVSLSISYTPEVGSIVYAPFPPYAPHTVVGLAKSFFTMHAQSGSWREPQLAPGWNYLGTGPGNISGKFVNIHASQYWEEPDTTNPVVNIWQGIWQPAIYTDRAEGFWTWPFGFNPGNSSGVWMEGPGAEFSIAPVHTTIAQMEVPISSVPGPGTGAAAVGALGCLCVRRRRSAT